MIKYVNEEDFREELEKMGFKKEIHGFVADFWTPSGDKYAYSRHVFDEYNCGICGIDDCNFLEFINMWNMWNRLYIFRAKKYKEYNIKKMENNAKTLIDCKKHMKTRHPFEYSVYRHRSK